MVAVAGLARAAGTSLREDAGHIDTEIAAVEVHLSVRDGFRINVELRVQTRKNTRLPALTPTPLTKKAELEL